MGGAPRCLIVAETADNFVAPVVRYGVSVDFASGCLTMSYVVVSAPRWDCWIRTISVKRIDDVYSGGSLSTQLGIARAELPSSVTSHVPVSQLIPWAPTHWSWVNRMSCYANVVYNASEDGLASEPSKFPPNKLLKDIALGNDSMFRNDQTLLFVQVGFTTKWQNMCSFSQWCCGSKCFSVIWLGERFICALRWCRLGFWERRLLQIRSSKFRDEI